MCAARVSVRAAVPARYAHMAVFCRSVVRCRAAFDLKVASCQPKVQVCVVYLHRGMAEVQSRTEGGGWVGSAQVESGAQRCVQ